MNILVTGARGFVGKNLVTELKNQGFENILEFNSDTSIALLDEYCKKADFVFHLAGVNRPKSTEEFMEGNFDFTSILLNKLKENDNRCPIMVSSSIQAKLDNPYGKSKKAEEELVLSYQKETGATVFIYRFTNLYGKWSKPNYNTVVATFCYKIARGEVVEVNEPSANITLCYIDDVVRELINCLYDKPTVQSGFCIVPQQDETTVGELEKTIRSFKESRKDLSIANLDKRLEKNLYSTYLSFLPEDRFSYPLKMNVDQRGSFTEFIRTPDRGQVSVNVSKPGIVKGNHWHHTKNEKFLVVSGKGVIRFKKVDSDKVIEYFVSEEKLEVVDIPVGYTHNIENIGDSDMVTLMWANEPFDPENPDTYYVEV
ncbi:polysaccharide biosynthesis C-terminal domain-containing protein [Tetragenococcus koreensis]|uniref:Capsular polysaccharide biosynthesis protein Cap8F n=1 Tax=Tetragenococcus koreensis TaxID=290335 RepID=A0AAN4RKN4_9ENTE|nr:NAD-dependent epimerase/dehydratase family protein [Tetragenococcus koreensis]GEQ49546.1 capsular polysaccharide biosynthesis protein Cap8F [Tetragenococcus koreensis]GEQ51992.1 capsular polysaccharide biosynthesis protein Cap8F [Tetragenococcus koreensis]GEQ54527.1 capsular polysaccharide biosynthesis protein Cap8F [Tetragenococcus koreensis]GEQ56994.1 capsular polysaccharide biosynthesis protein Cap8F [Tetragenococcus koreensis]GEQ59559.1 capsular polysaccharide biosynthesis protein Cap8F